MGWDGIGQEGKGRDMIRKDAGGGGGLDATGQDGMNGIECDVMMNGVYMGRRWGG